MKKGFTLIELLAVIIILAVIALIATPIVINVVQDAREKARQESIHGYAEAVILTNAENQLATTQTDLKVGANAKMKGETVTCETVVFSDNYGAVLDNCTVGSDTEHVYYFDGSNVVTVRPSDMDDRLGDVATNPIEVTPTEESCFEYTTSKVVSYDINYDVCLVVVKQASQELGQNWSDSELKKFCNRGLVTGISLDDVLSNPSYLETFKTYGAVSNVVTEEMDEIRITGYTCSDTDIVIPNKINNKTVTDIGFMSFMNKNITSVVISNNVKIISANAFYQDKLTTVIIPNSVETIGANAFDRNQLTSVTIGNKVERINWSAFYENKLTSIIIPNSVKTIGGCAFEGNYLTSVTIPNSVTEIGKYAFQGNQLTSVTIGNGVTTIEASAFSSNSTTLYYPGNIPYVNNPNLTSIKIDNTEGSIEGSPWGAENATITYLR